MRKAARPKPASEEQFVYDGRNLIGTMTRKGARHFALDPDGRRIGSFATSDEAYRAILACGLAPKEGHTR